MAELILRSFAERTRSNHPGEQIKQAATTFLLVTVVTMIFLFTPIFAVTCREPYHLVLFWPPYTITSIALVVACAILYAKTHPHRVRVDSESTS